MNPRQYLLVPSFVSCLFVACGGASAGGSTDTDATGDTDGPADDVSLDTGSDPAAQDSVDDTDALRPDADPLADTATTDGATDTLTGSDINSADSDSDTDGDPEPDAIETDIIEPDPDATAFPDAADDVSDTSTEDAIADTGADTTDPACEFIDLDIRILICGDGYTYMRDWSDPLNLSGACVPYFTLDGDETQYATEDEALNASGCATDCQYMPAISVSWLYCGRRSGYIIFSAASEECGDLYEMPEGIYRSIEEYEAANPCEP